MLTTTARTPNNQHTSRSNGWDEVSAIEKRFPRIANKLCALWGGQEIDNYIDTLLIDNRGARMGFPMDVLDELMFLAGTRWHLTHLGETVIESTSPEEFNYSGNRTELCGSPSRTWVLL